MKTVIHLVDDVYALLDVPAVYAAMLSGDIFLDRKPDGHKGECIVINALPVTGAQLQRGLVNVNLHTPNLQLTINGQPDNSHPNRERLKIISDAVLPLIKDAVINDTVTAVENITLLSEPGEHFLNIRIRTNSINL